jgi:hypothetical protein
VALTVTRTELRKQNGSRPPPSIMSAWMKGRAQAGQSGPKGYDLDSSHTQYVKEAHARFLPWPLSAAMSPPGEPA